jgi:hypothetical protein
LIRTQRRILFNSHWSFSFFSNSLCFCNKHLYTLDLGPGRWCFTYTSILPCEIWDMNIDVLGWDVWRMYKWLSCFSSGMIRISTSLWSAAREVLSSVREWWGWWWWCCERKMLMEVLSHRVWISERLYLANKHAMVL